MEKTITKKIVGKDQSPEKKSYDFSLIQGAFDFADAREILMTAYQAKINFHKLKAWSKSERGEVGSDHHTVRALELEIERDKIKELLLLLNTKNKEKLNISCKIRIDFNT